MESRAPHTDYHEAGPGSLRDRHGEQGLIVVYDLADPEVRSRAGRERRAWGAEFADVHPLDNEHVAIVFRPGGAGARRRAS